MADHHETMITPPVEELLDRTQNFFNDFENLKRSLLRSKAGSSSTGHADADAETPRPVLSQRHRGSHQIHQSVDALLPVRQPRR